MTNTRLIWRRAWRLCLLGVVLGATLLLALLVEPSLAASDVALATWIAMSHGSQRDGVGMALLLLIPGLLSVASVTPDTASGGVAFLTRLPLDARRVLGVKVA